ncbi:MAG: hypothetical protein IPJ61_11850 [Tessaracoccus sp.]|uniref:hypothetical protein n=1 Tax=Tessaracoccus sp. TaxID=1971211 RepID=UPI001ECEDA1A|nr:hypothetical protein [Tessaracoccus sp.]MBK7821734.1 hypothetical protein [Tessaracoccus sp.]
MNEAATAIETILGATAPEDLFDGAPADGDAARRARRRYRTLVALVHPDRAAANGVDPAEAQRAMAVLTALYDRWVDAKVDGGEPHVVGRDRAYPIRKRLRQAPRLSTYATDEDDLFIAISRSVDNGVRPLFRAEQHLSDVHMWGFGPRIVDWGEAAGRRWAAYRLPEGLRSLREVRAAYPGGLDGRDWAWMARRLLMVFDAVDVTNGALGLDSVLIHPVEHGVVVTHWGEGAAPDAPAITQLFDDMLAPDEDRQRRFAASSDGLSPRQRLYEYDLLLRALYGPRRFRPFTL